MTSCRLITPGDAPVLARLMAANREFMTPWDPARPDDYFTEAGQRAAIDAALAEHAQGQKLPLVIITEPGEVVGRITLNGITRGPFLSCSVGYWVCQSAGRRGVATAALRETTGIAFGPLGLHRIQAETLPGNIGSQKVLQRNGFTRIGMAPAYLKIAGRWQDHILYQLINHAMA